MTKHLLGFCAFAATAATVGCAGSSAPLPMTPPGASIAQAVADSWIDPAAKTGSLVYVTSGSQVNIYTWPKLHRAGVLTGFENTQAACGDAAGDVWIADTFVQRLYEFKHGATTPSATLDTSPNYALSCAVDKQTGDLAVGNYYSDTLSQGSVTIFRRSSGTGTTYYESPIDDVDGLDYGPNHVIYLDGWTGSAFAMASLQHGVFAPITIRGATINSPGGVQYVNGALTVADAGNTVQNTIIYRITTDGLVLAQTTLGNAYQSQQYQVVKDRVVCACYDQREVQLYDYPTGGDALKIVRNRKGFSWAAVVSPPTSLQTLGPYR
jgi:hypothetical protein